MTKDQKKIIKEFIKEAQVKLRLTDWLIGIKYDPDLDSLMCCTKKIEYKKACIEINPKAAFYEWNEFGIRPIKIACYHEVMHIVLAELDGFACARFVSRNQIELVIEKVTEHLARVLLDVKEVVEVEKKEFEDNFNVKV